MPYSNMTCVLIQRGNLDKDMYREKMLRSISNLCKNNAHRYGLCPYRIHGLAWKDKWFLLSRKTGEESKMIGENGGGIYGDNLVVRSKRWDLWKTESQDSILL